MVSPLERLHAAGVSRRLYPVPVAAALARARAGRTWRSNARARDKAIRSMELLVGRTPRAGEVEQLARRHLSNKYLYEDLLWRERVVTTLRVDNLDRIRALLTAGSGVIVSFLHQGQFNGLFASITRQGVSLVVVANPLFYRPPEPTWQGQVLAQQFRIATDHAGITTIPADQSFDHIVSHLRDGAAVALAADIPGSGPVRFLGRSFGMASGAAKASMLTGAPIVPVSAAPEGYLNRYDVQPALQPSEFPDADTLLQALFDRHEPAVLSWPEAVEGPLWQYKEIER